MKRLLAALLIILITSGCGRRDSSPLPTPPPVDFPTIAPETLPLCLPSDLDTSSNADSAPSGVVMGMTLTNKSKHVCTLSNPPVARLFDQDMHPLVIQSINLSAALNPNASTLQQLVPGGIVIFTLTWQNYCQPTSPNTLNMRLDLPNGQNLVSSITIPAAPACLNKDQPSTIAIGPYSVPP